MAEQNLNKIFLSASIPYPERDKRFYDTADIIAIRDAVRALATVVIPKSHLVWGGHPSITPLIRYVMERMNFDVKSHISIYQSLFFEERFPKDNFAFENIILTPKLGTQDESLELMRISMLNDNDFKAGIFIGGMEGIIDEFEVFKKYNPKASVLPVASTGAAAKIIFQNASEEFNPKLETDFAYMALFSDLLSEIL